MTFLESETVTINSYFLSTPALRYSQTLISCFKYNSNVNVQEDTLSIHKLTWRPSLYKFANSFRKKCLSLIMCLDKLSINRTGQSIMDNPETLTTRHRVKTNKKQHKKTNKKQNKNTPKNLNKQTKHNITHTTKKITNT